MNFLETIKPHLVSNDVLIQEIVLRALHDYPNVPEEWTVQLLKEAFKNDTKQSSIFIYIDNQKFNEEALQILIENIPQMDPSKKHLALRLLDQVEPKLAMNYRGSLESYLSKETWDIFELILQGSKEDIIKKYEELVNELETSYEHDTYLKAKKLAGCIVGNDWITEEDLNKMMKKELKRKWFTSKGTLTIYMMGLLKLEKFIPTLASLLERDDDAVLEEASAALISFQSDEVVRAVTPYLMKSESIIFAASIVENIKTELAVEALREAYRVAKELADQDMLVEALCHQLSKEALPEISKHMENDYDSGLVDVEQVVYSYYTILGLKHPELQIWKHVAVEREMDFRNESRKGNLHQSVPIRNENNVGRNDPCPCGSGKKYKKCCGK